MFDHVSINLCTYFLYLYERKWGADQLFLCFHYDVCLVFVVHQKDKIRLVHVRHSVVVPEVIEGCRINLLSEHVSYSWVGDDVRVKQRQTQSQQPIAERNPLFINTSTNNNLLVTFCILKSSIQLTVKPYERIHRGLNVRIIEHTIQILETFSCDTWNEIRWQPRGGWGCSLHRRRPGTESAAANCRRSPPDLRWNTSLSQTSGLETKGKVVKNTKI